MPVRHDPKVNDSKLVMVEEQEFGEGEVVTFEPDRIHSVRNVGTTSKSMSLHVRPAPRTPVCTAAEGSTHAAKLVLTSTLVYCFVDRCTVGTSPASPSSGCTPTATLTASWMRTSLTPPSSTASGKVLGQRAPGSCGAWVVSTLKLCWSCNCKLSHRCLSTHTVVAQPAVPAF